MPAPGADSSSAPSSTATTTAPAGDLSPRLDGAGAAGGGDGTPSPSSDAAGTALPEQLALADILPFTPTTGTAATAPADAPAPTGPAPAGEAVADYGHAPASHWPLVAGMCVSLVILLLGGAFVWWRNRDTRYWPA